MNPRAISSFAAVVCGLSVGLGAYASHVAEAQAQERLALAALFGFGHGLALLLMARRTSRQAIAAQLALVAGIVLFSGSLAAAGLFSTPTIAAPFGGSLLILGWLLAANDYGRNS